MGGGTSDAELDVMRHSAAHVLARAVQQLYPGSQVSIGPVIENAFYCDIDLPDKLSENDLAGIEVTMRQIVDPDTSQIGAFKLLSISGAYRRGDEKQPMLQRIYGTAWQTQDQLEHYLVQLEDARRRDHRRIGKDLGLFMFSDLVGPGLPLWLPKGATIRRELERWVTDLELERGYQHVITPDLARVEMYQTSGHWDHYQDDMFPVMKVGGDQLVLRPMNCPHHIQIYRHAQRSYRELPFRISEFGAMWRYEKSGELSGLSRVRRMDLNDSHIFCAPDQILDVVVGVVQLIEHVYGVLGITDHWYRLSMWDPDDTAKYVDDPAMWARGQQYLRDALARLAIEYVKAPGEAAFYGPKIDVQLRDPLGHSETTGTVQVDFHLPNQFKLEYVGDDGQFHRPVMIHHGVINTLERMVAFLIEKYGGAFPLWLAPVQAVLVPIADRHNAYAESVATSLRAARLRVEVDARRETMRAKIRDAQAQQVPYMLVVGDRDQEAGTASVRDRRQGDRGARPVDEVVAMLAAQRDARR